MVRKVRYKVSCYPLWFLRLPRHKTLDKFLQDVPYALYFSVAPSLDALNEYLGCGADGGGQASGYYWQPFTVSVAEHAELFQTPAYILDEEILSIPRHSDYLRHSREKYENLFWPKNRR